MAYLIGAIVLSGIFGGIVNFLQSLSDTIKANLQNFFKSVIPSIAASFLVPLFLNMISSNLIKESKCFNESLLIFVGFCLIAAIFSKRFIDTIGEKVLQKVKEADKKADEALATANASKDDLEIMSNQLTDFEGLAQLSVDTKEIEAIANNETEISTNERLEQTEDVRNKISKQDITNIYKALKDKTYAFRTLSGISKSTKITDDNAQKILNLFVKKNLVKVVEKNGKTLFALTEKGHTTKFTE